MHGDIENLKNWFSLEKRVLPWREDTTAYRVWISEVMLQQTRAAVVVGYFKRWMQRFPTVEDVASADIAELMKMWEGLGYYRRVRSIYDACCYLVEHHGGKLPEGVEELKQIPGVGRYTAGAIASFAYKKKAPAVDANVARVISRYFAIEESLGSKKVDDKLDALTLTLLPDEDPHIVMEGLIELGATVCGRRPTCALCPLRQGCRAFALGVAAVLPKKKERKKTVYSERFVFIIRCQDRFAVCQGEEGKVLGGLYEFPSLEKVQGKTLAPSFKEYFGANACFICLLDGQSYSFTHHVVELFPSLWDTKAAALPPGCVWKNFDELQQLPFSSGHRRILNNLSRDLGL